MRRTNGTARRGGAGRQRAGGGGGVHGQFGPVDASWSAERSVGAWGLGMRGIAVGVVAGMAAGMLAGCSSPFGPGPSSWDSRAEDLRTIEPITLTDFASAPTVSVDEGLARLDERLRSEMSAREAAADLMTPGATRGGEAGGAGAGDAGAASAGPGADGAGDATDARDTASADAAAGTPDPTTLDLTEVRAAALAGNLDLQVRRVDPEIAALRVREEAAAFEAVFSGGARWSRTDTAVALSTEGSQTESLAFDVGVSAPLRTGGDVSVTFPVNETKTNNPFSLLNPAVTADVRFTVSQPLLRGAGSDVATFGLEVARIRSDVTLAQTRLESIRVLAAADRAYWSLYAARRNLDVTLSQLELARVQEAAARRRVEAGDAPSVEIDRAASGVAERIEAVIVAENEIRRRTRALKRLMNRADLPLDDDAAIEPSTEPAPVGIVLETDQLITIALANRMEMLELELQLAIDHRTIDLRKNERLPLLTLDYTYNVNGLGRTYNDAFDQLPPRTFDDWTIGLRGEVPIGNEAAQSRYEQALLTRVQRLATVDQRQQQIRQEVLDAADLLRQSWLRILAARREVQLAGRTFEGEQRQFRVGASTSTDVLDAAARLAASQFREIQAVTDYEIAQVDLAEATGTLLGLSGIEWLDTDDVRERRAAGPRSASNG